jgi:hypothetical protein
MHMHTLFFPFLSLSLTHSEWLLVSSRCAQSISTGVWMDAARPLIHFLCAAADATPGWDRSPPPSMRSEFYVYATHHTHKQSFHFASPRHHTRFYFYLIVHTYCFLASGFFPLWVGARNCGRILASIHKSTAFCQFLNVS